MEGGRALIEVTYTIAENAPIASGVYRLKLEVSLNIKVLILYWLLN